MSSARGEAAGEVQEKGRELLPEDECSGNHVMEALPVSIEGNDEEPDEEGEYTEDFPEEPEGGPGKGNPVSLHIGNGNPHCQFPKR